MERRQGARHRTSGPAESQQNIQSLLRHERGSRAMGGKRRLDVSHIVCRKRTTAQDTGKARATQGCEPSACTIPLGGEGGASTIADSWLRISCQQ